jgi:hypothetical protein
MRPKFALALFVTTIFMGSFALSITAATLPTNATPIHVVAPPSRKIRVLDSDNNKIVLNPPEMISVIVGTNEDSQDAARDAGKAMYPFQGRTDFQLVVVVDLRDSIANWVPSVVIGRMKSSLDQEAIELKPYYLKNGNGSNPRKSSYVVPDFSGTVCPQLGWMASADDLRVIIYGADGREVQRLDKVDDMSVLQDDVRAALQALVDNEQAKLVAAAKTPGSKLLHPVYRHPPLVPFTPIPKKTE